MSNTADTEAATWTTHPSGFDSLILGRYTIVVWTGSPAADLDDGNQVCEVYIPTTDRKLPDGQMIVGHRILDTKDRGEARAQAIQLARLAILDYETWHPGA